MLVENQHQGQLASSQRVVATYRLPWRFVGKPQRGQGAPVPEASGPRGLQHMAVDISTPRARVGAEPGVPTVEPLIPSSPGSSSLSEGEHQGVPFVPISNAQAPSTRDPRAKEVAGPKQRKRDRVEAVLDDGDSQNTTEGRRVRRRHEQWNRIHHPAPDIDHQNAPEVDQHCEGSTSSSPPLASPPVPPQNASSSSAPLDAIKPLNQPPPRTEGEIVPTLTEVNPGSGSITGGATIWLQGMDFPSFPLFARFGTAVVPTVSSLTAFVRLFLIDFPRNFATPTFFPVTCLPQPPQALSTLHFRSIHRQMRRSMEPASRGSSMK